tara:strand:+ start:14816 stop:15172 length:357 start_codon:yes stop_codon:yes gene_type:complete
MSDALKTTFIIKINDSEKEVFMSFALLNTITGYFENPEQLSEIFLNPQVRESILVELLSERNPTGRITKQLNTSSLLIDPNDVLDLLEWVAEHVENFFTQAFKKANQRLKAKMKAPNA